MLQVYRTYVRDYNDARAASLRRKWHNVSSKSHILTVISCHNVRKVIPPRVFLRWTRKLFLRTIIVAMIRF